MEIRDETKKVSVIVVIYNGMSHIEDCVSSVLNQTYRNFEIILVDNCSTDGSLDFILTRFPDLITVANNRNLGYGGGINKGLEYSAGDYIVPLNQDTEVDKNWLAHMTHFLNENPAVGAVCPKSIIYNDRTKISALGADIHISGFSYSRAKYQPDGADLHIPIRVNGVSGSAYMVRGEILAQMGGLEECFGGMDDVVLSWTLNLMGYEIYCVPDSILYHKHQLELSPDKLFYFERDRMEMLMGSLKPLTLTLYAPFFILIELLMMGYCLLKGRAYVSAKAKVWWSILKNINRLREIRQRNDKLRGISDFELFRRLKLIPDWHQLSRAVK